MPLDVLGSVETPLDHADSLVESSSPKRTQTNISALPRRSLSDTDKNFSLWDWLWVPPDPTVVCELQAMQGAKPVTFLGVKVHRETASWDTR